jgi:DNA-directed RNA polymerase subunit RPC12/RpoP
MTHYHCDNCNTTFSSTKQIPRCPECNRICYKKHDPIKPEKKKEYRVKKFGEKE